MVHLSKVPGEHPVAFLTSLYQPHSRKAQPQHQSQRHLILRLSNKILLDRSSRILTNCTWDRLVSQIIESKFRQTMIMTRKRRRWIDNSNPIYSGFGTIFSYAVIRKKRTNESLKCALINFDEHKDCEQAYLRMQRVLIDGHRIHVDFSQSVSSSRHAKRHLLICPRFPKLSGS
jgi:hypothetical protein